MSVFSIAILDDEISILPRSCATTSQSLSRLLKKQDYQVCAFSSATEFYQSLNKQTYHVLLLDLNLGDTNINGLDVLEYIQKKHPSIIVIIITGTADITKAVKALKFGAKDIIEKPLESEVIIQSIKEAESQIKISRERNEFFNSLLSNYKIIGQSDKIKKIKDQIKKYANLNEPVLITGESGTGKELVAAQLHYHSQRCQNKYYQINIACLSESLLEDEPFGYIKGAYSGANQNRDGIITAANNSTLFIDEIGDMRFDLQAKLLRVIQEKQVRPLGSNENRQVKTRFVFATNKNLVQKIKQDQFREDLYFRISALNIKIPPLRDRLSDLPELAEHFIKSFCLDNNLSIKHLSAQAMQKLEKYSFPGNIRKLKNHKYSILLFLKKITA